MVAGAFGQSYVFVPQEAGRGNGVAVRILHVYCKHARRASAHRLRLFLSTYLINRELNLQHGESACVCWTYLLRKKALSVLWWPPLRKHWKSEIAEPPGLEYLAVLEPQRLPTGRKEMATWSRGVQCLQSLYVYTTGMMPQALPFNIASACNNATSQCARHLVRT
jgi:hypothetical protein